jgi:uncharacterized membrane protein
VQGKNQIMLEKLLPITIALATTASALGQTYEITDLGPIDPFGTSSGRDINNNGQSIGKSTNGEGDNATTLWLPAPAYGRPQGPNEIFELNDGNAYGMNDLGQLTGFIWGTETTYTPVFWDPITGLVDLGALGATNGIGRRVNNSGWVIGEMDGNEPDVEKNAFLYDGTQVIQLETFGGAYTRGYDINESGQAAGSSQYPKPGNPTNGDLRATLWLPEPAYGLPAGANDLDTLSTNPIQYSVARGMNDLGEVVCWGQNLQWWNQTTLALWIWLPEPNYGLPAGMNNLYGTLGMNATAFAQDINNRGEIIFRANFDPNNPLGDWRATLWRQGEWFDLNARIPVEEQSRWWLDAARGINEQGQIVGEGYLFGQPRGFLLTPVVESVPNACTADISGPGGPGIPDGFVDAVDYLLLIAQWGSPCTGTCEADIAGPGGGPDGSVDALDFLELIAQWGDCTDLSEDGACCFDLTGDCQQVSAFDCAFMGGTFTPGASCETMVCDTPVGACCFYPEDYCEMRTEWACSLIADERRPDEQAVWLGPGTDCATAVCPEPPTGDRIEDPYVIDAMPYSTLGSTQAFGHDYDAQCPSPGSPTGYAAANDIVYAYTPAQDETITISLCAGSWYDTKVFVFEDFEGNVVACNDDYCTTPNYTEGPFVSRIDVVDLVAGRTYYIIVDGFALEAGLFTLDIELIASGACCLPDETCFVSSQLVCLDAGGNWLEGDECAACPTLPRGACCLPDGNCVANQLEYDCINVWGGVWQGAGTGCFGANCP